MNTGHQNKGGCTIAVEETRYIICLLRDKERGRILEPLLFDQNNVSVTPGFINNKRL